MKRWIAFFCCVVLLCCLFTGCGTPVAEFSADVNEHTDTTVPIAKTATLPFNHEDTLDPFSAKTQSNLQLSALLYDSLVIPDDTFTAKSRIVTIKQTDDTHISVQVKSGIKFSDGSSMSGADIVYSFEQARKSVHYKERLKGFTYAAANGKTVVFTLAAADNYSTANLCFPIVKQNTATDNAATAPIGSGAYVYQTKDASLKVNSHMTDAKKLPVRTIKLQHLASVASVLQALENGSIQYMYSDLSDGNIPRTSLKGVAVDLPRLVYIGVNGKRSLTNTAAYRKALSSALDRTAITAAAYTGRAKAAVSPFHPSWKPAKGLSCMNAGSDTKAALSLAKQALLATTTAATTGTGTTVFTTTTKATTTTDSKTTGSRKTTAKSARELVMIYPSGNSCRQAAVKMIVSQLAAANIKVKATPLAYKTYLKRLKAGKYDLYLGEILLTPDMSLTMFLQKGGAAAYGVDNTTLYEKYVAFRQKATSAASFVVAFGEEMPYIPLCWMQGMAAYAENIPVKDPTAYNLFKGLI